MRIVLDAMGTDDAPRIEVAGTIEALREHESDVEVILVGVPSHLNLSCP